MRNVMMTGFAVVCLALGAAPHPDLSGSWKMDPTRSESAHQDVPLTGISTLVITHTPAAITIEATRSEDNTPAAFHELLKFRLDGSETPNTGEGGVTAKAHWEGNNLVAETVRNVEDSTVTTRYIYMLSPNSRVLTVDKTLIVQHGYMGRSAPTMGHGKDTFVRVKP
jgi:hypothetical protein